MSMMTIIGILSETGAFEYIAQVLSLRMFKKPFTLLTLLATLTAVVSAFIDNVTTVLMISPIVIEIAKRLRIDPRPLLLAIVFASNIGGTATLIGDPPNILIGTAAGLGFMQFIYNLTPAVIISFISYLVALRILFSSWIEDYREKVRTFSITEEIPTNIDKSLFFRTMTILGIVIALFFLEDVFSMSPAIPPLIGVGLLLLLVRKDINIEKALEKVDWTTLVFFVGMFIVIRGVERLGVMSFIANELALIGREPVVILTLVVWVSASVSAFVDNIPFVMSMIPVIPVLASLTNLNPIPMYWALSLGGCLGGNGTLVGASANVVVAGLADRYGYNISFNYFTKYGIVVMITTVATAMVYLILVYG